MREWLVNIRKQLGYTQEEIALKAYINRSYYSQIESGTRNPSIEVAQKLAEILKVNPTAFFEDCFDTVFEEVLKDAPVILTKYDLNLRYTWIFNGRYPKSKMTHMIGKKPSDIDNNNAMVQLEELKKEVIEKEVKQSRRIEFQLDDSSSTITYEIISKPLYNAEGHIIGGASIKMQVQPDI